MKNAETESETGIATLFFRDTRALILLVGMVSVGGLTSLMMLPRMEDPVLTKRVGLVATRLPGADAERVEALVTEPIEDRLQDIEEIKKLTSSSRPGISTVTIELRDEVIESDEIWSEVRGKLNDSVAELPPDAQTPTLEELDVRAYALIISVAWQRDEDPQWGLLRRYAKTLEDALQTLPGTEVVDRFADPGEEVTVSIDPQQAAALGLNATAVAAQLSGADVKQSAGVLQTRDNRAVMEMANQFHDAGEIEDTLIRSAADGRAVKLGDVADVRRGVPSPLIRYARVDGRAAVSLGVMVRNQQRIDLWRRDAQQIIEDFNRNLPSGMTTTITLDQDRYVNDRLSALTGNLLLGVAAVVLVVWMLMGLRSALVVALALPLSGFSVLFGLRILEIPIHQMSITGLIIAIGLLIDNAIVAVDEVTAEIKLGQTPVAAVGRVVRHLVIPLTGSTITTALAFAPIAMMPGPAGEFVGAISVSVILAVFASLFFSLTVIPVVAAKFVNSAPSGTATDADLSGFLWRLSRDGFSNAKLARSYKDVLRWCLVKPSRAICLSLMLPVTGFALATQLPEQFFPAADRDQFYVELALPTDASIAATERASRGVDEILRRKGAVKISWFFGESAPVFYYNIVGTRRGTPNFAAAIVQMPSSDGILESLQVLQRSADEQAPGARVLMRQLEQGPPFTAPIEVRLLGPDLARLQSLGDEIRVVLASVPSVTHTRAVLNETLATVSLDVDEAESRLVGLTPKDVSQQLHDQLEGASGGRILEDTEQVPVRVRIGDDRRGSLQNIRALELTTTAGNRVPLSSLARISLEPQIAVIPRINRRRMNEVAGFITAGTLPSKSLSAFESRLAESGFKLPPGYTMEFGGETSQRNQAVGNLMANVGLLAIAMVATLVLSFRSFRFAAVILCVAGFSTGLGMIGLSAGGYPFGFMAIIGTMGLVGVAINDSIVVLAAIRQREQELVAQDRAINIDEVVSVAQRCTRHVIATTLTTIAGFAPLIIAGGKFWPPLALAIAGGVAGATVLALAFVPAIYVLMRRLNVVVSTEPRLQVVPQIFTTDAVQSTDQGISPPVDGASVSATAQP